MLRWLAVAVATLIFSGFASAEGYPSKPIHLVVAYPPGGPTDVVGRLYASRLQDMWGQPVVVENRPGANGSIAAQLVAKSANDGYTLLLHASSLIINPLLYSAPGYDAFKDFAPVAEVFDYKLVVVVHPSMAVTSLKDLVEQAKAKPGTINFASAGGVGAPTHLSVEMFKQAAGIDLVHIPYQGGSPAVNDLLAGVVPMMFNNPTQSLPYIKAGKLRAIATTGLERMKQLPDVPTVAESGYPGYDVGTWFGVWAPAGTPADVIEKLNAAIAKITQMPDTREKLYTQGLNPIGSSVAEFTAYQKAESERWAKVIKAAAIKLD
ncbi:MAG: tripartite tricarboxylate transporter substrate binding protein [Proteobacteria bacterium]|nr:tripartite tricarboxylate transporter substrate binding protein [Pseudomonadota bacterium]